MTEKQSNEKWEYKNNSFLQNAGITKLNREAKQFALWSRVVTDTYEWINYHKIN